MSTPATIFAPLGALVLGLAVLPLDARSPEPLVAPVAAAARGADVAIQAGTIHLVENGTVLTNGTIVVVDGRIAAVGKDVAVPPGMRVVDYGPDAVIVPGFVAADTPWIFGRASDRTVDPFVRGADNFDPYASYAFALREGVTTAYFAPARGRLVAGIGAVVKLSGGPDANHVLNDACVVQGSISEDARNTPGYWQPPVPANIDVGMGVAEPQLPRSLMGAMVALDELFAMARGGPDTGAYGPRVGQALAELTKKDVPWRIVAETPNEIRAAIECFARNGEPLVLDGANGAGEVATEVARAGVPVIVRAAYRPNSGGRDYGKDRDANWPNYDVAARLAAAGARFAIAPTTAGFGSSTDLRFAAALMSRGGLDPALALRAITLAPAEILGVADRVGSLRVGKDADFVVLNAHPLDASAGVLATWSSGELAWSAEDESAAIAADRAAEAAALGRKAEAGPKSAPVVIHVDELHVGDGEVLTPGEILVVDGRIASVGRRVGRPSGAVVVKGGAAAPGMIDAMGQLGLEGSNRVPATRFEMKRIVEPGDLTDRRVARAGVTTVALTPRGLSRSGAPILAYKPAGDDLDRMIVDDPCALRLSWSERNRRDSGRAVVETLKKAADYKKKWDDYQEKLAKWVPPPPAPAKADAAKDETKDGEDAKDEKDAEKKDGEGDKKPEKKKKGEEEPPKPITGAWEAKVAVPPFEETRWRLYVNDENGDIRGSLRCDALSDALISVTGRRDKNTVTLSGEGSRGLVTVEAENKEGKLVGKVTLGEAKAEFEATQTSTEYEVVRRSELRKPKDEKKPEVKGEPKAPGVDPDLEPLRRAMMGEAAIVVRVDREDEILECVDVFEAFGIKPILEQATDVFRVADRIHGRVAGVLLNQQIVRADPREGLERRNRYADLDAAGIPVAFHSDAEEGAADLPLIAAYAVSQGMSPEAALRALTTGAAKMLAIDDRVGALKPGLDADIVLYDRSPLDVSATVLRVWVNGKEVR